jgi:hypothetical protein
MSFGKLGAMGRGMGHLGALGSVSSLPRYPNFPKTQIWSLRSTSDMASTPSGMTNITDTPTGGGVRLTVTTTAKTFAIAFQSPVNVTGGNVKFWFRAASAITSINLFRMRLLSAGTPGGGDGGNSLSLKSGPQNNRSGGWQYWGCSTDDMNTIGTGADKSAITWMYFSLSTSSGTVDVDFSDVFFEPNPRTKAAVIFAGDDASPTIYSQLYTNYLHANGYLGPMFNGGAMASAQGFDQSGRITTAQANEMIAGGGQFMSQAWSTESIPADYDVEYAGMMAAAAAKGRDWRNGSVDGSFYSSVTPVNETARQAMVRHGIRTIRRFDNGNPTNPPFPVGGTFPFIDELNIPSLNVAQPGGTGVNIPTYIGYEVERTKTNKGVLILSGHNDWSDTNVQTAVTNVMNDAAAGNIEIHTMSSLLASYLAQYGAAPSRY